MDKFRLNKNTKSFDRLIPELEAIEMLALNHRPNPKASLRWLMRARKLPYVKLGRGIFAFRQSDIGNFIESHRIAADGKNGQKSIT